MLNDLSDLGKRITRRHARRCRLPLQRRGHSSVGWENFNTPNPLWENHVVLLPKKHVESLLALEESDNDLLLELMRTAKIIAGDFMSRFGAARVYTNLGDYQSSKHLHWRIGSGKQLRPY